MTVPAEVDTIHVGRGHLEYYEIAARDGQHDLAPLVFLHEGLGSLRLWRTFPADVAHATGRRALVYSRHGYGASAVISEPHTVDYMHHEAQVILPEVFDRLGYESPVLIGHSDGASIALIRAATSTTTAAVVAMAPHVIVEEVALEGIRQTGVEFGTSALPERLGRYHTDAHATFRGWHDIWLSEEFTDWDLRPLLAGVTCPVLAVQGQQDQYATMRQLDLIAHGVSGEFHRLELPDCRHSPHLDKPLQTVAAVTRFLADLAG
ncbi:MAG: alpha/beta fold hydrolase [Euzebya sp.]